MSSFVVNLIFVLEKVQMQHVSTFSALVGGPGVVLVASVLAATAAAHAGQVNLNSSLPSLLPVPS